MNNSHIRKTAFILVLAGLCLAGRCHAVTGSSTPRFQAENDSGLSGKQIVKMGLDKFISVYYGSHRHKSNETACIIYQNYKEPDNKRRLACLPPSSRKQAEQLYQTLQDWEKTALQLRFDDCLGGTAWIYICVSSSAEIEQFLGQVIDCCEKLQQYKTGHAAHSYHAMRGGYLLLSRSERTLAEGSVMGFKDFRCNMPLFRRQTTILAKTLRTQSPAVQRIAAKYLALFAESLNPL